MARWMFSVKCAVWRDVTSNARPPPFHRTPRAAFLIRPYPTSTCWRCQEALSPEQAKATAHASVAESDPAAQRRKVKPDEIKREEERKRDAACDPVQRWL